MPGTLRFLGWYKYNQRSRERHWRKEVLNVLKLMNQNLEKYNNNILRTKKYSAFFVVKKKAFFLSEAWNDFMLAT